MSWSEESSEILRKSRKFTVRQLSKRFNIPLYAIIQEPSRSRMMFTALHIDTSTSTFISFLSLYLRRISPGENSEITLVGIIGVSDMIYYSEPKPCGWVSRFYNITFKRVRKTCIHGPIASARHVWSALKLRARSAIVDMVLLEIPCTAYFEYSFDRGFSHFTDNGITEHTRFTSTMHSLLGILDDWPTRKSLVLFISYATTRNTSTELYVFWPTITCRRTS